MEACEERAEVARPLGEQRRTHRSLRVLHRRVLRVRRRAHRARRADARAHVHGLGRRGQRRERRLELVVEQRLNGERNPLSDRCESLLRKRLGQTPEQRLSRGEAEHARAVGLDHAAVLE